MPQLTLRDGRILREHQDRPRGGPDAPMTRTELEAKFRGNAVLALSAEQAERIVQGVNGLAAGRSLAGLLAAFTSKREG